MGSHKPPARLGMTVILRRNLERSFACEHGARRKKSLNLRALRHPGNDHPRQRQRARLQPLLKGRGGAGVAMDGSHKPPA